MNNMIHPMKEIGEGINEIYYCPLMKAKIFLKGNSSQENENKDNLKSKKQFKERPGDWVCFNCKNLNFIFRTNCNRCNLSRIENQKLLENLELQRNIMNINYSQ